MEAAAELPPEAGVPTDEELAPCTTCGRTFVISSLQRHAVVCKKNATPSRGKFDSSRQRLQGTGLEPYKPPPPLKARPRSRSVPAVTRRGSIPQQPEHIPCEHCGRRFGDKAIERHQEWCKNQKSIRPPSAPPSPAFERMQIRTKYKAPLVKTLRATTREKYSPGLTKDGREHARSPAPTSTRSSSICHTPTRKVPKESYDVFLSAERQMQELLGSPMPTRKSQQSDIELNLDENFIRVENANSDSTPNSPSPDLVIEDEDSSIEDALNEIQHQDSFSSVEIFKDEDDDVSQLKKDMWAEENQIKNDSNAEEITFPPLPKIEVELTLESIEEGLTEKEMLDQLKATLEESLDNCPLTDSLSYLDAALSLFQVEDFPLRPRATPRSKASNKRRQYSAVSAMSLLKPSEEQQQCGECGSTFPVPTAKFCCLCGTRRSV